jgi:hypothetical protein
MSSIRSFFERLFSSSNSTNRRFDNGTNSSSSSYEGDDDQEVSTSTYRTYYKSANVNAYKTHTSLDENSGGGSYYLAGVLFMVSVIGLLLYVNLYYENCFRDTCYQLSKYRGFAFLRKFFVVAHNPSSPSAQSHNGDYISLIQIRFKDKYMNL